MDNKILFMIFCIESLAEELGKQGSYVYDLFTKKTNILHDYIIANYEVLHSQGKKYIVNDLVDKLGKEGIVV